MVKEPTVNFGLVSEDHAIEIEWELTIAPEEIVHFAPDCGCTANVRVEDGKIKTTFTEDDAKGLTPAQRENWYPSGKLPISKGITVYLRDTNDLIVFDANNATKFNEVKRQEKIGFIGYCEFKPAQT